MGIVYLLKVCVIGLEHVVINLSRLLVQVGYGNNFLILREEGLYI